MNSSPQPEMKASRLFILGTFAVVIVLGLILVIMTLGQSNSESLTPAEEPVNALAESDNECVDCHKNTTPGIIEQYGHSTMAAAEVTCQDCHEVKNDYPGAKEHEGTYVLNEPTTAICANCHQAEVAQYN